MLTGQHYRGNLMDRDKLKMMVRELKTLVNEIESEVSGKIVKILVDDSSPVEFDQPLFLVEPV